MILYILYFFISPILWIILFIVSLFNKKINTRWNDYKKLLNKSLNKIKSTDKKVLLLHSASNGELEQMKPIIRSINKKKYFIMLTTSSPSSINHMPIDEIDSYCYQAFDFPWSVNNFFKKIKPENYIITRHDIWPNHIVISKKYSTNIYLINANLPDSSKRLFPLVRYIYKYLFKKFNIIYTVSQKMQNKLSKLIDIQKIEVVGDTRFDQINHRYQSNNQTLPLNFMNTKNIVFGSIESKDLDIIFNAIDNSFIRENNVKLIFVPHEPSNKLIIDIQRKLDQHKIKSLLLSNQKYEIDADALIIDKVGILADIYKFSLISYIGCGFGKGVHNVIEPAIYGNLICFGPNYEILNEATEMINNKLAYSINNSSELFNVLKLINQDDKLIKYSENIKRYLETKLDASSIITKQILSDE